VPPHPDLPKSVFPVRLVAPHACAHLLAPPLLSCPVLSSPVLSCPVLSFPRPYPSLSLSPLPPPPFPYLHSPLPFPLPPPFPFLSPSFPFHTSSPSPCPTPSALLLAHSSEKGDKNPPLPPVRLGNVGWGGRRGRVCTRIRIRRDLAGWKTALALALAFFSVLLRMEDGLSLCRSFIFSLLFPFHFISSSSPVRNYALRQP
jgi:hypothetical protein